MRLKKQFDVTPSLQKVFTNATLTTKFLDINEIETVYD